MNRTNTKQRFNQKEFDQQCKDIQKIQDQHLQQKINEYKNSIDNNIDLKNSLIQLARLYSHEMNNFEEGEKYFIIAYEKGYVNASELAEEYISNDMDEMALKYYLISFEINNDPKIASQIGYIYTNNLRKYSEGKKYFMFAYEKGFISAYKLAKIFDENKDNDDAVKYYKISSENNNESSELLALKLIEQKKYEESVQYFIKSIENGNFDIIIKYIECLIIIGNKSKAYDLLEKYNKYKNTDKNIKTIFAKCVNLS